MGDVVYIGAYDGTLYAFERLTGLLLWRYKRGYQVGSSPAVVPEWGIVYSAHEESPDGGGFILALDARTGALLWESRTEAHPHSSVAVDVARGTVFVGDNRGFMYALDARTGELRWKRALDCEDGKADIKTTPMVMADRGLVVVGAWSGKVVALREDTGELAWSHATGGRIMGSTARLARDGSVFVGSPAGELFAIDDTTGATKWTFHVGARIMSSPAVSGDGRAVVFGASDGNIYAVRADTGEKLWSIHLGGKVSGSPTLVGDRIYVTSHGGALVGARDARLGVCPWFAPIRNRDCLDREQRARRRESRAKPCDDGGQPCPMAKAFELKATISSLTASVSRRPGPSALAAWVGGLAAASALGPGRRRGEGLPSRPTRSRTAPSSRRRFSRQRSTCACSQRTSMDRGMPGWDRGGPWIVLESGESCTARRRESPNAVKVVPARDDTSLHARCFGIPARWVALGYSWV